MNCKFCDKPLSQERLEAKPDAQECVPCLLKNGDVEQKKGHLIFAHKTAGEIEILSPAQFERLNDLDPRGYYKGGRTTQDGGE